MLTKKDSLKNEVKGSKNSKNTTQTEQQGYLPTDSRSQTSYTNEYPEHYSPNYDKKSHPKTRVTIKYDVGYPNQLYIRGKGANLSWDKGQPLKNVKHDEWTWETDAHFSNCEFKVLVNDKHYENGENHYLTYGSSVIYTPRF